MSHLGKYYPLLMQTFGWIGTVSYLLAYYLVSIEKISPVSKLYQCLNIIGAIGLIGNALYLADYPNIVVNMAWLAIGVFAIYRNNRLRF